MSFLKKGLKTYSIGKFSKIIGVTETTLRNWDKVNKLKPILLESEHKS